MPDTAARLGCTPGRHLHGKSPFKPNTAESLSYSREDLHHPRLGEDLVDPFEGLLFQLIVRRERLVAHGRILMRLFKCRKRSTFRGSKLPDTFDGSCGRREQPSESLGFHPRVPIETVQNATRTIAARTVQIPTMSHMIRLSFTSWIASTMKRRT